MVLDHTNARISAASSIAMPNLTSNGAVPLEQVLRLRISAGRRALSSIALTTLLSLLFDFVAQASVIQAG